MLQSTTDQLTPIQTMSVLSGITASASPPVCSIILFPAMCCAGRGVLGVGWGLGGVDESRWDVIPSCEGFKKNESKTKTWLYIVGQVLGAVWKTDFTLFPRVALLVCLLVPGTKGLMTPAGCFLPACLLLCRGAWKLNDIQHVLPYYCYLDTLLLKHRPAYPLVLYSQSCFPVVLPLLWCQASPI